MTFVMLDMQKILTSLYTLVEFICQTLSFVTNRKADTIISVDGFQLHDMVADRKNSGCIGRIFWIT